MINENCLVDLFAYYTKINYNNFEFEGVYRFNETFSYYSNRYLPNRNQLIKRISDDLKTINSNSSLHIINNNNNNNINQINSNYSYSNNNNSTNNNNNILINNNNNKSNEFNNYKLITKYNYSDLNSDFESIIPYDEAISFFENNIKSPNQIIRLITILEFFQYFMNKPYRNQLEFYKFLTRIFYDSSPFIPTTLNFFKSRFINYNYILISYIFNNMEMCDWLFNNCKDDDINKRIDSLINPKDLCIDIDSLANFIINKCIPKTHNQIRLLEKIRNHINSFFKDKPIYDKINEIINNSYKRINNNSSNNNSNYNEVPVNNNIQSHNDYNHNFNNNNILNLEDSILINIIDKVLNNNNFNNDIIITLSLVSGKFFNLLKVYFKYFNWNNDSIKSIIKSQFNGDSKYCLLEDSIILNNQIYYETIVNITPNDKINQIFSSIESITINSALFTSPINSKYSIQFDSLDNSFYIYPPSSGMSSLKSIQVIGDFEDYNQSYNDNNNGISCGIINSNQIYQSRNLNLIKYILVHSGCKLEEFIYTPKISNLLIDSKLISTLLRFHHSTLKRFIIKLNQNEFKSLLIQYIYNHVLYYYPNIKFIFKYKNSNNDYDFTKDINSSDNDNNNSSNNININNINNNSNNINSNNINSNNFYINNSSNDSTIEEDSDIQSIDDNDDYSEEGYFEDYQDFEYDDNYNHNFEELV